MCGQELLSIIMFYYLLTGVAVADMAPCSRRLLQDQWSKEPTSYKGLRTPTRFRCKSRKGASITYELSINTEVS